MSISRQNYSIGLAPMEGVTDFPCRVWFSLVSNPAWMSTPFCRLTPGFQIKKVGKAWSPELFSDQKVPYHLTPQLMASDSDLFIVAAKDILERSDLVELNCGCPAPRAVGHGAGSALLHDPQGFLAFITRITQALPHGSLSVKMRLGFNTSTEFWDLVRPLYALPLKRLVVHGRTREQRYSGYADWQMIGNLAEEAPFPVIGSGDICDQKSLFARIAQAPKISGVIIGRGALRNPWIFSQLKSLEPEFIDGKMLLTALEVFALLNETYSEKPNELLEILNDVMASSGQTNWDVLASELRLLSPTASRTSLARLKMLWNYLRSSLPNEFFDPQILREASLPAFLGKISNLAEKPIPLTWNAEYDWIYSGTKR